MRRTGVRIPAPLKPPCDLEMLCGQSKGAHCQHDGRTLGLASGSVTPASLAELDLTETLSWERGPSSVHSEQRSSALAFGLLLGQPKAGGAEIFYPRQPWQWEVAVPTARRAQRLAAALA